jgi:hypothetical protein
MVSPNGFRRFRRGFHLAVRLLPAIAHDTLFFRLVPLFPLVPLYAFQAILIPRLRPYFFMDLERRLLGRALRFLLPAFLGLTKKGSIAIRLHLLSLEFHLNDLVILPMASVENRKAFLILLIFSFLAFLILSAFFA